jgi:hypothetical protein
MRRVASSSLALLFALAACQPEGPDGPLPDGSLPDAAEAQDSGGVDAASPDLGGGIDADASDAADEPDAADGGEDLGPSWPEGDGVWGVPEVTFTLPEPDEGKGLYFPDLQDRFPEVDWATLDRLYIPAGHYPFIRLGNLPQRAADRPLVITNLGGQVRVGALDHHYLFTIGGGSNWVLTGRFDPTSQTGDAGYPGHRGGAFAGSQDTYGIVIDDAFVRDSVSGLGVGGGATDFEIEYLEITRVGFAGMLIKTDDDGDAHMANVKLHDLYIHDLRSEGFYIGSTQSQPQHQIRDIEIWNNRLIRTGTEAIQVGQLAGHSKIHHNVFGPAAVDWRDAFQRFQDNNFQLGVRAGRVDVHDNVFIGSAGSTVSFFAAEVAGDDTSQNVGVTFERNVFAGARNLAMYVNNVALPGMTYTLRQNHWYGWRFERDEVYADATPYDHLLRIANTETPVVLEQNTWSGPQKMTNGLPDEGNGERANFTGEGNVNAPGEPVRFLDDGLPDGFDWLGLEMWVESASLGGDAPVSYARDEVVTHMGQAYRCVLDPCPAGRVPPEHADTWEAMGALPDDVRLHPESAHQGVGLSPELAR